jgi:hypothetical protein
MIIAEAEIAADNLPESYEIFPDQNQQTGKNHGRWIIRGTLANTPV